LVCSAQNYNKIFQTGIFYEIIVNRFTKLIVNLITNQGIYDFCTLQENWAI